MEQAHTQLIAQLNERILAADNTPLYIKFAETVKNAVRSGVLEHGNILPGERDLSQLTGVSRITVRKAMQALEEEGVVTRSRGYGTQINNIFEYSLKEARGFSQQVVLRGKKPDTLWVNKRVVKCPEEVAQQLAVEAGSDVFLLKRIRYVDEEAVSIEESWVPAHLIHDVDAIGISLYDYFRSQHIYPQRTRSRVSARMPDAEFQSHIQLDSKIPVLVIKQVALDQQQGNRLVRNPPFAEIIVPEPALLPTGRNNDTPRAAGHFRGLVASYAKNTGPPAFRLPSP